MSTKLQHNFNLYFVTSFVTNEERKRKGSMLCVYKYMCVYVCVYGRFKTEANCEGLFPPFPFNQTMEAILPSSLPPLIEGAIAFTYGLKPYVEPTVVLGE